KSGVPILMGSDPVFAGMHGENYKELAALRLIGLDPLQCWFAATGAAAAALGRTDVGSLQVGNYADLLLFREDVVCAPDRLGADSFVEIIKEGHGYRAGLAEVPQKSFASNLLNRL